MISVPTLVLLGDRDPLTPPDHAEELAAAIVGSRLVVVPECGHDSTLEQPDPVNRALVEWLRLKCLNESKVLHLAMASSEKPPSSSNGLYGALRISRERWR